MRGITKWLLDKEIASLSVQSDEEVQAKYAQKLAKWLLYQALESLTQEDIASLISRAGKTEEKKKSGAEPLHLQLERAIDDGNPSEIFRILQSAIASERQAMLNDAEAMRSLRSQVADEYKYKFAFLLIANVSKNIEKLEPYHQPEVGLLALGSRDIEYNTALRLVNGDVPFCYIDDLEPCACQVQINGRLYTARLERSGQKWIAIVEAEGSRYVAYKDPDNEGATLATLFGSQGFTTPDGRIFVLKEIVNPDFFRETLIHETNHALNADTIHDADSFERYKGEFRAFWVSNTNLQSIADLNVRAVEIRNYIFRNYSNFGMRYERDPEFKAQVDAYTRPEGNLTNELTNSTSQQESL